MQTFTRASIAWALVALSSTVAGVATAHGPDDRPIPEIPGPLVGAIEITNERDRAVQIYVDGRFALEVRGRTTDVVERVPNGVRLVTYAGGGNGPAWQTDRVEVREGRRAALRIAPLRGRAAIVNRSGIELHVMLDELDLGMLAPGRELTTPPLAARTYRLTAAPHDWDRSRPQEQEVTIIAGEVVRAELRPFFASLIVTNPFPHKVSVFLDGRRVDNIRRGDSERFGDLQPGRVRVEMRHEDRLVASDVVELATGRENYYAPPLTRFGALEVKNPTRQAVRIALEGGDADTGFRLEPGQVRLLREIEAGPLTIQLTTVDGRIVKHQTHIVAGETRRFEVPVAWVDYDEPAPVRPRPNH